MPMSPAGDGNPLTASFNQSAGSSSALATTAAALRTLSEDRALNASTMAVPSTTFTSPRTPRVRRSSDSRVNAVRIVSRESIFDFPFSVARDWGFNPIDSALFTAT